MGTILYMVVLVGLMWFLLIRPQQQQAKKRQVMLGNLKTGTKVITIGGICGVIKALTDTKVYLEIADGLTIEVLKTAIGQIDESNPEDILDDEDDDEDDDLYYDEDDYEDDDVIEVEETKK